MKTKLTNTALLLSLTAVLACSKFESNDMQFKRAISEQGISAPSPGESSNPSPDPAVVEVPAPNPDVIVGVPTPAADSGSTAVDSKTTDTKTTDTTATNDTKTTDTTATTDTKTTDTTATTDTKTTDTTATTDTKTTDTTATTDTKTTDTTATTDTKTTDTTAATDTKTEPDIMYADAEIPTCKLNIVHNGAGGASRVAIASASKDDLKNLAFEGFDSLSPDELKAMKAAVYSLTSGNGVQVMKSGEKFVKDNGKSVTRALIVTDGKTAVDLNLNGLGKDAQIFLMNVSDKHNTVCLQVDGVTDSSKVFVSSQGDPMYVSRAKVDFNGSGAAETHVKVIGGNQAGSEINVHGFSDSDLYLLTEGKNDTFSAISANNVSKSHLDLKIKGKNDTGLGVAAHDIDHSKIHLEMDGADNVKALMKVDMMSDNDIDGFMNYHTGKVDPALADYIKVATYP